MMEIQLKVQKPLKDLVYLELKHKILTGEIVSQTRLMEIDLSEKMNVSRTPIREAIKRLADDGLVKVEPRRGAYVANISIKDMLDVFEVREDMEGFAAKLAAERITEEEKAELQKIAAAYDDALSSGDKETIIEFDEEFHNFIVAEFFNLLLDFFISRAVISFSARSAYASQRHQLIPPFIQFPLAVSRL